MNAGRAPVIDVFLNPGEYYFGDRDTRIRTLLGSCIAVTLWHPHLRIGGMCHFLLPQRATKRVTTDMTTGAAPLDGRYGLEAVNLLLRDAVAARADPRECRFKMFGGGNMFQGTRANGATDIGARNAGAMEQMFDQLGIALDVRQVGGSGHRNVIFEVASGDVWLRHQPLMEVGD